MGLPYAALMAGADLVLPDCHLDAGSLIDMIETLRPTVAGAVPTIWNDVLHYLAKDPDHDLSSLRVVACGGSAVPLSLMRTFEEKHGVQIRQLWGMTETSPMATMAWPRLEPRTSSIGRCAPPRANPCAGWRPASSTTMTTYCPMTARPSASWRFVVRGLPRPTTAGTTSRSLHPDGCGPATWAASTSGASSR
ncbi:AMP-binding enzyme family protein [Mycobacterium xenopi 3993]|nr:AMP-binding enzyme family protein [Mycobacterium xenopi 3993]